MLNKLKGLFLEEEGQGMTEYALVLGVIAVGVVAVIATLGTEIKDLFTSVTTKITSNTPS